VNSRDDARPDQPSVWIAASAEMPDGWKTAIERHAARQAVLLHRHAGPPGRAIPAAHLPDAAATTTPNPFRPKCRWLLVEASVKQAEERS